MRKNYEMTTEDLARLEAIKPETMIMLHCSTPRSMQEDANAIWAELGDRMGFDPMTVRPTGEGRRFFSAETIQCNGIEIEPGVYSGCNASAGDCPACGQ